MKFIKTIETFNKIAQKVKSTEPSISGTMIKYTVSMKQFEWLAAVYIKESNGWDTRFAATVKDEDGNQYSFSYQNYMYNVPKYIPNRDQYGKNYFITKVIIN